MTAYTERAAGSPVADFLSEHAQVLSIAAFFLACLVFFSVTTATFLTPGNILNVLRQAVKAGISKVVLTSSWATTLDREPS